MGDIVQKSLEELIPVFENLERLQIFDPKEIKYIIRKCKTFEYKLTGNVDQKSIFLAYIQYLYDFSLLIFQRRKSKKCWINKDEVERILSKKIETLFKFACNRYKSDVNLWLSRINFAKKKTLFVNVSKLYFALLQVHPNKPNLWISAAKYEFEEKNSVDNARSLMQRALRFNPKSEKLWLELFRMELLFIEKLLKRQMILKDEENPEIEENEDVITQGKLALLVFRHALQEINSASFCLKFIEIAKNFNFAVSVTQEIYNFLKDHFKNSEETHECLISLHFSKEISKINIENSNLDNIEKKILIEKLENECYKMYKNALSEINSEKMWTLYLNFCISRFLLLSETLQKEKFSDLHAKFTEAAELSKNVLSLDMYLKWLEFCHTDEQREFVLSKSIDKYPKSIELRLEHLKFCIKKIDNRKLIMKSFNSAIAEIPEKEALPLWKLALEWSLIKHPDKVKQFFEKSFSTDFCISAEMKRLYLEYLFMTCDFDTVRNEFKRLCLMKPNSMDFYDTYVKMELASPHPSLKNIRNCYENAIFEYGHQNIDLWTNYFQFESNFGAKFSNGSAQEASKVYSRALKTLNANLVEKFIEKNIVKS